MFSVLAVALFGCSNSVTADMGGDSLLVLSGGRIDCIEGSTCDPRWVRSLPHTNSNDVAEATNAIVGYDCDDGDWSGNEMVYAFNIQQPGSLQVDLDASEELNAFVVARDQRYACTGQGQKFWNEVLPGRYWLVVDSKPEAGDTAYDLKIDFVTMEDADIADQYEPNDTPSQAASFDVGIEETWEIEANLTPTSRVDYYLVELEPVAEFYLSFSDPNIEVEIVDWAGPEDGPGFSSDDEGNVNIEFFDWSGEYQHDGYLLLKFRAKDELQIPAEGYEYQFEMSHDHTA